jgi:hypothetical protein
LLSLLSTRLDLVPGEDGHEAAVDPGPDDAAVEVLMFVLRSKEDVRGLLRKQEDVWIVSGRREEDAGNCSICEVRKLSRTPPKSGRYR